MNKILFIFLILIISFSSCDGRDRAYKSNAKVSKSNTLFESFSKQVKFFPNKPIEISTDTILSNGFQIKLHYQSLENSFVSKTKTSEKYATINTNYNNFEAKFQVFKDDELLINQTLNKSMFSKYETPKFWKDAIMQFVWVDFENSSKDFITLNTAFHIPETNIYKDFCIQIDKIGTIEIRATNLNKKIS